MKAIKLFLIGISVLFLSSCASRYLKMADEEYAKMNFSAAVDHYGLYLQKKNSRMAEQNLARSFFKQNDFVNAKKYYLKVLRDLEADPKCVAQDYLNFGRILMSEGEYEGAIVWLNKVLDENPGNVVARMLLTSCFSIDLYVEDSTQFSVKKIDFSGFENTFSPVKYENGIIFTGDKKIEQEKKISTWTGNSYLELYYAEKRPNNAWKEPLLLTGEINGKYHEGPSAVTADGERIYFSRNNYIRNKIKKDEANSSNIKIFSADNVDGKWENIQELPFNSDEYSVGQPALSPDEKRLFFASDMPGGFGGTDLWVSEWNGKAWGFPVNLGEVINTPANEMFPYMHYDSTLYFSSDAHNGLGGLDIFSTRKAALHWEFPKNLNYPMNTGQDDFGFVMNSDNRSGYFSSSRGDGKDKIYEFKINMPTFFLKGTLKDKETIEPLESVSVILMDKNGVQLEVVYSSEDGQFDLPLKPNQEFEVRLQKEGYFAVNHSISTVGKHFSENKYQDFYLQKLVVEKAIVMDNIYYDYGRWEIREDAKPSLDKLVKLLNDNPEVKVELGSHTDSRSNDAFNLDLSNKRAYSAVQYIIAAGIPQERIVAKGYGEYQLVNHCRNLVACSDEEHQRNRRTEFKVLKAD